MAYLATALIAAGTVMLAAGPSAGAAPESHIRQARQARQVRPSAHARSIRLVGKPAQAKQPKATASRAAIAIPAIGVTAGLESLGGPRTADVLSLPTPPLARAALQAGWYQFSAVPGSAGNAVIVGHVDTYTGPGVFYNLYQLLPGEAVYVNTGGTRQRFKVTSAREMPKARFPVNQVFGPTKKHMLWLITCGGAFDFRSGHYLDNIVVSAIWVPAAGKQSGASKKSPAKRSENQQRSVR